MTPPWPREWGPNTPVERARFLTRVYRDAALSGDPDTAVQRADRVARAYGEAWLFPVLDTGDEWITLREFAALAGCGIEAVRQWYKRAAPSWATPPQRVGGRVRRADAEEFLAARDTALDRREAA